MSDETVTVWLLEDNGGATEGVYASPEQFTALTGYALVNRREDGGQIRYDVDAPERDDVFHRTTLTGWKVNTHIFEYLYPDGRRRLAPKPPAAKVTPTITLTYRPETPEERAAKEAADPRAKKMNDLLARYGAGEIGDDDDE